MNYFPHSSTSKMGKRRLPDFIHHLDLDFENIIHIKKNDVISEFNYYIVGDDTDKFFSSWYGNFIELLVMRILYEKEKVFSIDSTFVRVLDKSIPTHSVFEELSLMTYCKSFNFREISVKKVGRKVKHSKIYAPFHAKFVNLEVKTRMKIVSNIYDFISEYFSSNTVHNPRLQYKSVNKTPDFVSEKTIVEIKACRTSSFNLGLFQCLAYYAIIKKYDPDRVIDKLVIINFKNLTINTYVIRKFGQESINKFLHFLDTGEMRGETITGNLESLAGTSESSTRTEDLVPVPEKKKNWFKKLIRLFTCR